MLQGRTILITGAARGLGLALATYCASAGATLIIADRDEAAGQHAAATLAARFVAVDLAEPNSILRMAEDITAHEGRLDGLVNNAAIATGIGGPLFEEIEIDTWDRVMAVNVRGTWLMIRACATLLRRGNHGRIVNIASDTALWGAPRLLAYTASKGAVMSMTRSLARELGPEGIGITAVAPGILRTESTEYVPPARHKLYEEGRAVPGPQEADDIAPTVAFLLTAGALTLTGQVLPVNRGFVFT